MAVGRWQFLLISHLYARKKNLKATPPTLKLKPNLTLFITPNFLLPKFLTIHIRPHLCTHQERPTQFPIERVRFLRWRGETVFEHDGDEGADGLGDCLFGEWVWAVVGEGGGDEGHGVEMRLDHFVVFLPGQIPQIQTLHAHPLPIPFQRAFQQPIPPIHEFFSVFSTCAKIDQLDLG